MKHRLRKGPATIPKQPRRRTPTRTTERKVHRESMHARRQGTAACGQKADPVVLTSPQFVWLPRRRQCDRCVEILGMIWWGSAKGGPKSATPEMETIVESLCVAIARFGQQCAEDLGWIRDPVTGHWCDGPNEKHRCYLRVGVEPCVCGHRSLAKLSTWETAKRALWKQERIVLVNELLEAKTLIIQRAFESQGISAFQGLYTRPYAR